MTQEEILKEVQKLLFEDSRELSRADYRDLLEDVIENCNSSLNAMDEDGEDEEE